MGRSGHVCLSTSSHLGQSGVEVARLPMQKTRSDCSGEAQQALVLGSNGHIQSDSTESAQPVNTALQSDPSQKSENPESPYMAQSGSIRSVNDPKWCITNQVDFRAPLIKSVADFLMYLF